MIETADIKNFAALDNSGTKDSCWSTTIEPQRT